VRLKFFSVLFLSLCLISCGSDKTDELTFFSMDTIVSLCVNTESKASLEDCRELISELEGRLSRTVETSDISVFNNSSDSTAVSQDTAKLIEYLLEIAQHFVAVKPDNPRALEAHKLAEKINTLGGCAVYAETVEEGMAKAAELADGRCPVFALGSLYMYGEIFEANKKLFLQNKG